MQCYEHDSQVGGIPGRVICEGVSLKDGEDITGAELCAMPGMSKGTRVLISLWDSLMFGRVPTARRR